MPAITVSPRHPMRDRLFLEALEAGKSVGEACEAAEYSRAAAYRYRAADADFRHAWNAAVECHIEVLERDLEERARGVDADVFYAGKVVGTEKKYSDNLLLARLKALAPERYARPASRYAIEGSRLYDFAGIAPPQTPDFAGYEPRPAERYRIVEIAKYIPCLKCDPEQAAVALRGTDKDPVRLPPPATET